MVHRANKDPDTNAESTPARVLLVDDQPELRRLLRRTLIKAGYDVVEASDGRIAVELAQQIRFDVVISDVGMPDMSGVELLQALRDLDPDLPVVLTSGWPEAAPSLDAFAYLEKPVAFDMVCSTAARAIELRRARSVARESMDPYASTARLRVPRTDDDPDT